MVQIALVFIIALGLAWPLGHYMARVFSLQPHVSDRLFGPVEHLFYRIIGVNPAQGMTWKGYMLAFLFSNLVLGSVAWLLLLLQPLLPMNPDSIGPLSWDLALHTAVSFLTNTNQQHYSGQAQLSYLSQSVLLVTLQVVTPSMGLAVCVAILRGLSGGRNKDAAEGEPRDLGNYHVDVLRAVLRVMLPLALLTSLLLTWQGVPSTYAGAQQTQTLDPSAAVQAQTIPVGPVAAMVAIKQLGSNGGGWYGPNSANPLENPTPVSNLLETIAIVLIPMAIVVMAGVMLGRLRFAVMSLAVMGVLSLGFVAATVYSERQPNAAFAGLGQAGPNMEGKEVRFGPELSALWASVTTQTSNGSVNAMHDSLNPLGGLMTRAGMLVNAVWGGIGVGFINYLVYVWITVFLSGLMIGRTPEFFGRKLETREISALGVLIVLPPLVILTLTAITVGVPGLAQNSNPGFHGISQVFYEYTSAFANNGSGFEGLGDNTVWWNLTCVLALLLGRYLPMILPLMVAGWLASKRVAPVSSSTLRLESTTFAVTLLAVVLILNFLSFLPSAVLGPIGEALELSSSVVTLEQES